MRTMRMVSAALVACMAVTFMTSCGSPEGGAAGWTPPPIGLSGSVSDTDDLEDLAARIAARTGGIAARHSYLFSKRSAE